MKQLIATSIFTLLLLSWTSKGLYAEAETVVVIVHKDSLVNNLSTRELARIYKGRLRRWQSGGKIVILNRPIQSTIRFKFYKKILKAGPSKRFHPPKSPIPFKMRQIKSEMATKKFVARIPNSISYIYLREVDSSVKILRIDGLTPENQDYKLK